MAIHTGNEKTASRIRAKAGTITTVLLLAGVVTAAVVSATPGPRPEVEENERSKAAEHAKGAERDGKPSKADLAERKAAFLEDLAAKVEAGELTRAEAGEMIAGLEARIAEHAKGAERDGKPSKADLAERKAAFLEDLTAKVKAGELTRAEAGEMIAGLEARIAEHAKGGDRDGKPSKADLAERKAAFLEDLTAKVKAGELTRAEAGEMIAGLKARIAEHAKGGDRDGKPSKADLAERKAAFLDGLDAKVEAGELTQAEADEMIARMRARIAEHAKQIDRPSKADMDARKAAFLDGLDAKVEAGELTQAEADEMIARMRARIAEHAKQIDRPSKAA